MRLDGGLTPYIVISVSFIFLNKFARKYFLKETCGQLGVSVVREPNRTETDRTETENV